MALLLMHDIPKLARLLRILDFANFMTLDFKFALHNSSQMFDVLNLTDQEKLLLLFEQMRGVACYQEVTFAGPFDTALVQRVTQKVQWLRAGAAEIHDLALSIKRMGDLAFKIGNADMAFAKWDDTHTFLETTLERDDMVSKRLGNEFLRHILSLDTMTWIDHALLWLSNIAFLEVGKREYGLLPKYVHYIEAAEKFNEAAKKDLVPKAAIARYYRLLGIAELGLEHPVKAAKAFAKSYKMASISKTKQGYEVAQGWKNLTPNERKSKLDSLRAGIPTEPLSVPDFEGWQGPQVASEHWVSTAKYELYVRYTLTRYTNILGNARACLPRSYPLRRQDQGHLGCLPD
jgi:hypothetical protein